jgi:hypothetical protein
MANLVHASHRTPAADAQRTRRHQRLVEVMDVNGTTPDEIRWPAAGELQPSTNQSAGGEDEAETTLV